MNREAESPDSVGAEKRPGELKPCVVGDSPEVTTLSPDALQSLTAAASAALPVGEIECQTWGTRQTWGTHARPGRIKARSRAVRLLVRAAVRAMEHRPEIEARHAVAALRSLALSPSALLVNSITGGWLSTREAVAHRGEEISRALAELALIVKETEAANG